MGSRSNETMPPAKSSRAKPRTSRRLLRAKSTTRRIIHCSHLLLQSVLQRKSVRDDPISRFDPGDNFLQVAGKHVPGDHFQAFEMARTVRNWRVYPLAIV